MYGYQMIEELGKRSNDTFLLKAGTLYPILHTLEQEGKIESYEAAGTAGKPRKILPSDAGGPAGFGCTAKEWDRVSTAINRVLHPAQLQREWLMLPAQLEQWLDRAVAQLRCRAAVQPVKAELKAIWRISTRHFLAEEDSPEQAARKTVEGSMGDAVLVGGRLDEVHRPRSAWGRFSGWQCCLCWERRCVFWRASPGAGQVGEVVSLLVRGCVRVAVLAVVYFGTDLVARMRHTWLIYGGALALVAALCTPHNQWSPDLRTAAVRLSGVGLRSDFVPAAGQETGRSAFERYGHCAAAAGSALFACTVAGHLHSVDRTGALPVLRMARLVWMGARQKHGPDSCCGGGLSAIGCLSNPHLVERMLERSNPFSDPRAAGWTCCG